MAFKCKHCAYMFTFASERRKHVHKVHSNRIARTCCNKTYKTLREKLEHDHTTHAASPEKTNHHSEIVQSMPAVEELDQFVTAPDGKQILLFSADAKHPFSNFKITPFIVNGTCFRTVEHYYQSEKARYFQDFEKYWAIRHCWTPHTAKHLGAAIQNFNSEDWRKVCEELMCNAVREKVRQLKKHCAKVLI